MAYKRKTRDVWELQGYYDGWAFILYEFSFKEAKEQLKVYMEHEPNLYRIVKKRIRYDKKEN